MATFLSWNLYHGTLGAAPNELRTPNQRITHIVKFGINEKVDVICLQEVPQALLDNTVGDGEPDTSTFLISLDAKIPNWRRTYGVLQIYSENNPSGPHHTHTADGYLIFYNAKAVGRPRKPGVEYYKPDEFEDLTGATLRPPVKVTFGDEQKPAVTVMNWHADVAGPQVTSALTALHRCLGSASTHVPPVVILADLNLSGSVNQILPERYKPFDGWDDLHTVIWNKKKDFWFNGIDHILTSRESKAILAEKLSEIRSDSYHYPVAVEMPL